MKISELKFLVVGAGSIGTRHLKNLLKLGVKNVEVCDPDKSSQKRLSQWFKGRVHSNLSNALKSRPHVAVITTPTHLHAGSALKCAEVGCHLFIEKPLSHNLKGLDRLQKLISKKHLICLVGCNLRFHPGLILLRECLEKKKIGKIWGVKIQYGYYLPAWRPGKDYKKTYSAKAGEGGGVILDCIHELDYARWFFGRVVSGVAYAPKKSILGIDVEENVSIVLNTRHDIWVEIHLDYLQKAYKRQCYVFGDKGGLEWDWNQPGVRWFDSRSQKWTHLGQNQKFETNQMYLDEMKHFLRCVCKKEEPVQNLRQAREVLNLALSLKKTLGTLHLMPVRYDRWS